MISVNKEQNKFLILKFQEEELKKIIIKVTKLLKKRGSLKCQHFHNNKKKEWMGDFYNSNNWKFKNQIIA